jgi:hypothetical protein
VAYFERRSCVHENNLPGLGREQQQYNQHSQGKQAWQDILLFVEKFIVQLVAILYAVAESFMFLSGLARWQDTFIPTENSCANLSTNFRSRMRLTQA